MIKKTFFLLPLLFIANCSFKPPEPDPVFKSASGFGPHDIKTGCLVVNGQVPDCSSANERVKKYLSTFLPSKSDAFSAALEKNNFDCKRNHSAWECSYDKSQAPAACVKAIRVNVKVTFPAEDNLVTDIDINVSTTVAANPENHDEGGCFPL